jgi:hypothetical protein
MFHISTRIFQWIDRMNGWVLYSGGDVVFMTIYLSEFLMKVYCEVILNFSSRPLDVDGLLIMECGMVVDVSQLDIGKITTIDLILLSCYCHYLIPHNYWLKFRYLLISLIFVYYEVCTLVSVLIYSHLRVI